MAMTNLDSVLENRYHFVDKGLFSQCCGFSSSERTGVRAGPQRRLNVQ